MNVSVREDSWGEAVHLINYIGEARLESRDWNGAINNEKGALNRHKGPNWTNMTTIHVL